MNLQSLKQYMLHRMDDENKNLEEQEYIRSGRFNFGVNRLLYQHLPSWSSFLQGKKRLIRSIWIKAFSITFILIFLTDINGDKNIWKSISHSFVTGICFTLFFTGVSFFTIAAQVNRVQKDVRRLIYEDLLEKINQEESHSERVP